MPDSGVSRSSIGTFLCSSTWGEECEMSFLIFWGDPKDLPLSLIIAKIKRSINQSINHAHSYGRIASSYEYPCTLDDSGFPPGSPVSVSPSATRGYRVDASGDLPSLVYYKVVLLAKNVEEVGGRHGLDPVEVGICITYGYVDESKAEM